MSRLPDRITAEYLANMAQCLQIEDVVLLPVPKLTRQDLTNIKKIVLDNAKISKLLPKYCRGNLPYESARNILGRLVTLYDKYAEELIDAGMKIWKDPDWIEVLPAAVRGYLKNHAAFFMYDHLDLHNLGADDRLIGFECKLLWRGMYGNIFDAAKLGYQNTNPQLANKVDATCNRTGAIHWTVRSFHQRGWHLDRAYALATIVAYNLRHILSRQEQINLRIALLTHDGRMPVMGDEIIEFDPAAFCEVENYHRLIRSKAMIREQRRYGFSAEEIIRAVSGVGYLGKLTDIIDKISYGSMDLWQLYMIHGMQEKKPCWLHMLCNLVEDSPELYTVWDSIGLRDGRVFIADPDRLANVLLARVLMFRWGYYNPDSRSTPTILAKSVLGCKYATGQMRADDFHHTSLCKLDDIIEKFVGHRAIMHLTPFRGDPRVETFATLEEAYRREKEIFGQGVVLSAIEDCRGKINPATHFLVQTPDGRIMPFHDAYPKKADKIHRITHISKPIYLMYLNNLRIPSDSYFQMREFKLQQFAQRGQLV